MTCVHCSHASSARRLTCGALEINASETIVTSVHTLRFREKREVAVLLTSDAIRCRISAGLAVAVTLHTEERGI